MKILTILGARPQFIKAAALSREIKKYPSLSEVIVHTGQHFDPNMSDIFFEEMNLPAPSYNLNINGLSHGAMTGQMLEGIEKIIIYEKPNLVLVYGDTNSTIAGALAAKKLHVPVGHVEAGLRSFNNQMPEEINRILTDRISDLLFCPTDTAVANLKKEGFDEYECSIVKSGDVMEDAIIYYKEKAMSTSYILKKINLQSKKFLLATIHRAENTDNYVNLKAIVGALNELHKQLQVVVPMHPRTKKIIEKYVLQCDFTVIEPVGYFDMINLLANCSILITDSGGLQKEAFFFRKFCCTIRDQTEWVELVEYGYNFIVGTNQDLIIEKSVHLLSADFPEPKNLYGNGSACATICKNLIDFRS
jgi:UDP-GlcNAc3NAcA epimerase